MPPRACDQKRLAHAPPIVASTSDRGSRSSCSRNTRSKAAASLQERRIQAFNDNPATPAATRQTSTSAGSTRTPRFGIFKARLPSYGHRVLMQPHFQACKLDGVYSVYSGARRLTCPGQHLAVERTSRCNRPIHAVPARRSPGATVLISGAPLVRSRPTMRHPAPRSAARTTP